MNFSVLSPEAFAQVMSILMSSDRGYERRVSRKYPPKQQFRETNAIKCDGNRTDYA